MAAYDLRVPPMLWHYRAVRLAVGPPQRAKWPDGSPGREYTPAVLEVDDERLHAPYADETEFNRLPADARNLLGDVPLLVRIQYLNECHALNGAAAMALVRYAARRGVRWRLNGEPVRELGWRWGNSPGGLGLQVTQARTTRVKRQAHAHQTMSILLESGGRWLLDLSAPQFGDAAALRCAPWAGGAGTACAWSPTLRERAAQGIAPAFLGAVDERAHHCRLARGQVAVEEAIAASRTSADFALCSHVMPAELFGVSELDADLVHDGVAKNLLRFEAALDAALK